MARVSVTTQQITRTGLVPVTAEPTIDGDAIDTGETALYLVNASAGTVTVTVAATAAQDGLNVEDLVVNVVAGATALIGPFPMRTFGQPAGAIETGGDDEGRAYVDYLPDPPVGLDRAVVSF